MSTFRAIYDSTTGALLSVGDDALELPPGLASVDIGPSQPDWAAVRWNPGTRALEPVPAPSDDSLAPAPKPQLDPTPAVGRKVLRDLATDAARDWMVLDALNKAVQADAGSNANQKAGAAALAQAAYNRAQRLVGKWNQAAAGS